MKNRFLKINSLSIFSLCCSSAILTSCGSKKEDGALELLEKETNLAKVVMLNSSLSIESSLVGLAYFSEDVNAVNDTDRSMHLQDGILTYEQTWKIYLSTTIEDRKRKRVIDYLKRLKVNCNWNNGSPTGDKEGRFDYSIDIIDEGKTLDLKLKSTYNSQ